MQGKAEAFSITFILRISQVIGDASNQEMGQKFSKLVLSEIMLHLGHQVMGNAVKYIVGGNRTLYEPAFNGAYSYTV